MQNAALHWHVYLLTKSPLALGFVGLTRVLPIIAFSLFAGILADRRDRRRVMFVSQVADGGVLRGPGRGHLRAAETALPASIS